MTEQKDWNQVSGYLLFPLNQHQFWKCHNNFEHSWRNTADSALQLFQNCEAAGNQPSVFQTSRDQGRVNAQHPTRLLARRRLHQLQESNPEGKTQTVLLYHLPPLDLNYYANKARYGCICKIWFAGQVITWDYQFSLKADRGHQSRTERPKPREMSCDGYANCDLSWRRQGACIRIYIKHKTFPQSQRSCFKNKTLHYSLN